MGKALSVEHLAHGLFATPGCSPPQPPSVLSLCLRRQPLLDTLHFFFVCSLQGKFVFDDSSPEQHRVPAPVQTPKHIGLGAQGSPAKVDTRGRWLQLCLEGKSYPQGSFWGN